MRVSPAARAFGTLDETLAEAARSAEITNNHPEGIKGAQATATAIFLARQGESKAVIRELIQTRLGYKMTTT
jgi:ADP-ribosylglycohydrolase